jgi:hypothetical protein
MPRPRDVDEKTWYAALVINGREQKPRIETKVRFAVEPRSIKVELPSGLEISARSAGRAVVRFFDGPSSAAIMSELPVPPVGVGDVVRIPPTTAATA